MAEPNRSLLLAACFIACPVGCWPWTKGPGSATRLSNRRARRPRRNQWVPTQAPRCQQPIALHAIPLPPPTPVFDWTPTHAPQGWHWAHCSHLTPVPPARVTMPWQMWQPTPSSAVWQAWQPPTPPHVANGASSTHAATPWRVEATAAAGRLGRAPRLVPMLRYLPCPHAPSKPLPERNFCARRGAVQPMLLQPPVPRPGC